MDLGALYREHGPAILAACRRATGDDATAATLTPRVFVHVQRQLGDLSLVTRVAQRMAGELKGPRLLRDAVPPTEAELARARERFNREVYKKTLPLVEHDQRPQRILRWLTIVAPLWVALAFGGVFLASKNPTGGKPGLALYAGETPLTTGMQVKRGDQLRVVIDPDGFGYVTVFVGARVFKRIDHLPKDAGPITIPSLVVDERPLRVHAAFSYSPAGLPARETGIELKVE